MTTSSSRQPIKALFPRGMWADAQKAAEALRSADSAVIATHIDADGIAAAAIAEKALKRVGKETETVFHKKLDADALVSLAERDAGIVWFTDLGSGSISKIDGTLRAVVTDHHVPDTAVGQPTRKGQALLSDFGSVPHVNPHVHGISGANELSGAGATLMAALALDDGNADLAHLAVLGAVGDLQDQKTRRLEGLNRSVLSLAEREGLVSAVHDIRFFGRETRPIHKLLEFSSDPVLPRITGSSDGAFQFLREVGIEPRDGVDWRTWADLTTAERTVAIDALEDHLERCGRPRATVERLTGEVYVFLKEPGRTPLRDAKEFATLMNACGRHGRAELGVSICMGDRGEALSEGMSLLRDHRSALSEALLIAKGAGITRLKNIQFFDAEDEIEDTIIGTVAGMLLGSQGADRSAPMIAFANSREYSDPPKTKASSRGTQELVAMGMDLSEAIRKSAETVGGIGGGHDIAAGATIPSDRKTDFLRVLDETVGAQLSSRARRRA